MLWLTMREVTKYTMKIWRNSDLTSSDGIKKSCGFNQTARLLLFHAKDMVQIILSGIYKMVDIDRVKLDFVNDVLIDEQSPETVFAHQRIIFQYTQLRKICKLLRSMRDFISKLFCVRRTGFGFVVFQKGQKPIACLI